MNLAKLGELAAHKLIEADPDVQVQIPVTCPPVCCRCAGCIFPEDAEVLLGRTGGGGTEAPPLPGYSSRRPETAFFCSHQQPLLGRDDIITQTCHGLRVVEAYSQGVWSTILQNYKRFKVVINTNDKCFISAFITRCS